MFTAENRLKLEWRMKTSDQVEKRTQHVQKLWG